VLQVRVKVAEILLNPRQTLTSLPKTIRFAAHKEMNNPHRATKLCQANNSTRKAPQHEILSRERRTRALSAKRHKVKLTPDVFAPSAAFALFAAARNI